MALIHTIQLFKNKSLAGGESGTSQVIDLRNLAEVGNFALAFRSAAGTAGTAGTTIFSYTQCSERGGTYLTPSAGYAIGTAGTGVTDDIVAFSPVMSPFMKVIATQTGIASGKDSKVSAELIVR
jgi:hypothetical protein